MTITRHEFSNDVQRSFFELTRSGMEPNEACALALKLAAGMVDPLLPVQAVRSSLDAAASYIKNNQGDALSVLQTSEQSNEQAVLLEDAAIKVHMLFSNPESLHAAFWRPAPCPTNSSKSSSNNGNAPGHPANTGSAQGASGKVQNSEHAPNSAASGGAAVSIEGASVEAVGLADRQQSSSRAVSSGRGGGAVMQVPQAVKPAAARLGQASGGQAHKQRQQDATPSSRRSNNEECGSSSSSRRCSSDVGSGSSKADVVDGLGRQLANVYLNRAHSAGGRDSCSRGGLDHGSKEDCSQGQGWVRLKGPHEQVVSAVLDSLDVPAINDMYKAITALNSPRVLYALNSASEKLVLFIMSSPSVANPGFLRQLSILLLNPLLADVEFHRLMATTCSMLVGLDHDQHEAVVHLLASQPPSELHRLVIVLQQYITITLYQQQAITQGVEDATKALKLLYDANDMVAAVLQASSSLASRGNTSPVPYAEFYNDAVNNEDFNLKEDFRRWKSPNRSEFSFCNYPYVYDPASKARVLQMENQMTQYNELQNALFRGLFSGNHQLDLCPFLVLKVRRGAHFVQDTLIQINRAKESDTLRRPLKVKFVGEEGVDEGGVQKEFFQLLVKELFNPDYGMFTYDEVVRLHWFRPSHLNMETEFELVGVLIGLAIYNSHILEFSFPLVLFKKLTGMKPTFHDIQELFPDIHQNLSKLVQMSEDAVAACGLSFTVDMECGFGEIETVELKPGGSSISVTHKNCQEYVDLYTKHLLELAIQPQYVAFERGFLRLCNGKALSWFRPQELELLACGGRQLDLEALENATIHDDGYTRDSQVVRWFWETVHAMGDEGKRRLLFFVTGSDRVPIKGLAHLNPPHVISRMGGDCDRLPTAHTCFNHLLLPAYTSKEMLQDRLQKALEYAEGFGLL